MVLQSEGMYSVSVAGTQAYVMGRNSDGQLGLGDTVNRDLPVELTSPSSTSNISAFSLGFDFSALLAGMAFVWVSGEPSDCE